MAPVKSKNQLRRERAKLKKQEREKLTKSESKAQPESQAKEQTTKDKDNEVIANEIEIEIETVPIDENILNDPSFAFYKEVLSKFRPNEEVQENDEDSNTNGELMNSDGDSNHNKDSNSDSEDDSDDNDDEETKLSKRQFKKKYYIPLSILKAEAKHPELVEPTDADSDDPRLYIYLKSLHNVVPIPKHWSSKRGYLTSKRSFDRPPFELPKFILDTGILEMRDTSGNKEDDEPTLRQRMRERVQPKMGQLDIDFNKLYNAFFKFQTKPEILKYGQVYYEGLDHADKLNQYLMSTFRPGVLSDDLKKALGMSDTKTNVPPWSERMKIIGPPPSYPYMKINSDGTVKFNSGEEQDIVNLGEAVDKSQYGRLDPESDEESEDDDDNDDDDEEQDEDEEAGEGAYIAKATDILIDSIGDEFVTAGDEEIVSDGDDSEKKLYSVLREKKSGNSDSIYGSEAVSYDIGDKRQREEEISTQSNSSKRPSNTQKSSKKFHF